MLTEKNDTFLGKLALVTGAGRGIGRAIALHFARLGADVVVNYFRNRKPAEQTVKEIQDLGRKALPVKADVGTDTGLDVLFGAIDNTFGGLDILIHNAASGYNRPALQPRRAASSPRLHCRRRQQGSPGSPHALSGSRARS